MDRSAVRLVAVAVMVAALAAAGCENTTPDPEQAAAV
jgi:predicted small secreted protein